MNKLYFILLVIIAPITQAKSFHCYAFGYSYNYDAKKLYISNIDKFKTQSSNSHVESHIKKHWENLFKKKVGSDLHYRTVVEFSCEYSKNKFDAKKKMERLRKKKVKEYKQKDNFRVKKIFGLSLPSRKFM